VTTTDTPADQGLVNFIVDGVRVLCDEIGPTRRCPCREHPMQGWDNPAFVPHWWTWERRGQSGTFWCNVGPVGGWRAHARRVA
jgi:hypothetical protein